MSGGTSELIERGLHAWATGDLDTLESVFDPAVTLRTVPPGEWDCVGREELMWLLRQRQAQGSAGYPISIEEVDEHTLLVTTTKPAGVEGPQPLTVATRITLTGGKVTAMQQYHSDDPPGAPDIGCGADRVDQAAVRVGGDQLDPGQTAGCQVAEDPASRRRPRRS
jgi:hypothetical protein